MDRVKYYVSAHRDDIQAIRVERETESSVFFRDHFNHVRHALKIAHFHRFFDDFEAARNFKVIPARRELRSVKEFVAKSEKLLKEWQAMTPPEPKTFMDL